MFNRLGALTTRRAGVRRGLEEFFEKGQRLPVKQDPTGRAWAASELRQKSWEDLQKLWYVVLKERNVLASQVEEAARLKIPPQFFSNRSRIIKCKKTMARIKTVLNERRLAWEKTEQAKEEAERQMRMKIRAARIGEKKPEAVAAETAAAAAEKAPEPTTV
ncbi:MRP-L47-domain-containing protein [Linderina pennispora]|uniref:Large ribosomal subunit protein uL29m n=1 Tax=Linderina pennispora TaxID=61395 RepID=A0A1Y1WGV0_9FUNG|nr:MRP-L47-domain-containing protein [Linderina pennispora]ORX72790.1 MRP-L47-domain-containing protein [Linderina pennispora]